MVVFLRATADRLINIARINYRNSVMDSVCRSVCHNRVPRWDTDFGFTPCDSTGSV